MYASLVNQTINLHTKYLADKAGQNPAGIFDQLIQLTEQVGSPNQPCLNTTGMALTLASQGLLDEANQLLPHDGGALPDEVEILYAMAEVSRQSGDHQRATEAVRRITQLLEHQASIDEVPVFGEAFSLLNLGRLLLENHQPAQAADVFSLALQTCPNDAGLLKLLAESYKSSHQDPQAADTLQVLVSLYPGHMGYRRDYAQALEEIEDWEASLKERSLIIGSDAVDSTALRTDDMYAYAHCALKAGHPELALNICTSILASTAESSQALIYAGEAHLQMNETEKGLEFLLQATQVAPQRAETWLALAYAQKKIVPLGTVIDTLKNATQAVPNSAQIHFALGDLYLQDNTPTLALPDLQSALELSPDDPQILFSFGQALKLLGHTDDAASALSKAYRIAATAPWSGADVCKYPDGLGSD